MCEREDRARESILSQVLIWMRKGFDNQTLWKFVDFNQLNTTDIFCMLRSRMEECERSLIKKKKGGGDMVTQNREGGTMVTVTVKVKSS